MAVDSESERYSLGPFLVAYRITRSNSLDCWNGMGNIRKSLLQLFRETTLSAGVI